MQDNKYKYLAKNTMLFTLSSFGSKLLVFFLVPLYTAVLTTEAYGTADLITTTSGLLIFVATVSIENAVMRFAIDSEQERFGVLRFGIKVVFIGSSIAGLLILLFAIINPIKWDMCYYLFLYLMVFTIPINSVFSNYLRAIDKVYAVAVNGIVITATTIMSNLLLLLVLRIGIYGYLISIVLSHIVGAIYCLTVIYKYDRSSLTQQIDKQKGKRMIKYSFPLVFNGLAWWVNSSLDRYGIVYFYGASLNGLYAVATKIPTILNVVNQIFISAWNISAIKEYDREDKSGFFSGMYAAYNFVLLSGCSVLIMLNIPLARILFANEFFDAWKYSSILVISTVFSALSSFVGSIFSAVKNSRIFAVSTVIAAIINAALNLLLIPSFGAIGAAIATAISFMIVWLIRYICAQKYLKLNNSLLRDIIGYLCIITQAIIEHLDGHGYLIQVCLFVLICVLYRKEIVSVKSIFKKTINKYVRS